MKRVIPIVKRTTGKRLGPPERHPDARSPQDFDRQTGVAALDARSHAHYGSVDGTRDSRAVHPDRSPGACVAKSVSLRTTPARRPSRGRAATRFRSSNRSAHD